MKKRFSKLLDRGQKRGSSVDQNGDSPEATITREVKLFCESGGPSRAGGDEVTHLPAIVDAAESSPKAAETACYQIRKTLSQKSRQPPHRQYNAIMLMRILTDNPGATFTAHMDGKFVDTLRDTCRLSPDPSVQQLLRETLQNFVREKRDARDPNMKPLLAMWGKEQNIPMPGTRQQQRSYQNNATTQSAGVPSAASTRKLPPPDELASRIEEAKTSSKLLVQLTQTTPPAEFESHELIREFADRCNMAYRSLQAYTNCTDPEPDEDTLKTLIESCEQLSLASSKYQRAKLAATRHRKSNTNNGAAHAKEMPASEPAVSEVDGITATAGKSPPEKQADGYLSGPLAPSTFSPFTSNSTSAGNPFSDENRISMNAARSQQQQPNASQGQHSNSFFAAAHANNTFNQHSRQNSSANRPPQQGSFELPASNQIPNRVPSNAGPDVGDAAPPPGPPPGRNHVPDALNPTSARHGQTASAGSYSELYDTSPTNATHMHTPGSPPQNNTSASHYSDLYSLDQDERTKPNHESAGEDASPIAGRSLAPQQQGKVKDDEPMTPVAGVSGSGWRY